ncbi:MAG: flagellar hook-associated protein 3 [Pseudomonas sp.]|uniref:flagellar hook-associated protein 3 n=1 Tax=Pseudomonas sp. TaxID=306 RepID=UPI003BB4CCC2
MRISSIQTFNNGVSGLQRNYANVTQTQEQISSGKRILTPADDPVASVRLLQLDQQQATFGQYKANLTAAKNSLVQEETSLGSVINVLQRIRELTVQAGGGALSSQDRKAIAKELGERENELLNQMNTRNARGEYLFSGFLGKTEPFVRNPDNTYSYKGDEGQRSLQIASSTNVAINDNGQRLFEGVTNADRVQTQLLSPAAAAAPQRVFMSPGLVEDNDAFNNDFRAGEPYRLEFISGKEFRIYDAASVDVTSEVTGAGSIDPLASSGNVLSFRGMRFQLDVALQPGDNDLNLDSLLADTATPGTPGPNTHSFSLQSAPTAFASTRASGNTSAAVLGGGTFASVADKNTFDAQFPTSGVLLRFNGADFDVYSQPYKVGNTALLTGVAITAGVPDTVNVFGATLDVSGAPAAGDEFAVQPQFQEQRSILNTIARLRQALESAPSSQLGNYAVRDEVNIALKNLDNGIGQVLEVQTEIGARMNLVDSTENDNEDVTLVNKAVQSELRDLDYAEALSRLSFQTIVLEAAQQSYVKIAGLNLFDQLR